MPWRDRRGRRGVHRKPRGRQASRCSTRQHGSVHRATHPRQGNKRRDGGGCTCDDAASPRRSKYAGVLKLAYPDRCLTAGVKSPGTKKSSHPHPCRRQARDPATSHSNSNSNSDNTCLRVSLAVPAATAPLPFLRFIPPFFISGIGARPRAPTRPVAGTPCRPASNQRQRYLLHPCPLEHLVQLRSELLQDRLFRGDTLADARAFLVWARGDVCLCLLHHSRLTTL